MGIKVRFQVVKVDLFSGMSRLKVWALGTVGMAGMDSGDWCFMLVFLYVLKTEPQSPKFSVLHLRFNACFFFRFMVFLKKSRITKKTKENIQINFENENPYHFR